MKYLFLILFSTLVFSQNHTIKYLAIPIHEENVQVKAQSNQNKTLESADNLVPDIKIELIFNDSVSVFKIEDGYKPITLEEKLAITKAGLNVIRYMNIVENKSYFNNNANPIFDDKEFLVYDDLDFKWEFTNEEKQIDNFRVLKAIGISNKSGSKVKVTAWFAPELPFKYGPFGIGNLPGIILEMQIGSIQYVAKEIVMNGSTYKIEIPKKGKLIFIDDFYIIQKERLAEMMND